MLNIVKTAPFTNAPAFAGGFALRAVVEYDSEISAVYECNFMAGCNVHHSLEYLKGFIFPGSDDES